MGAPTISTTGPSSVPTATGRTSNRTSTSTSMRVETDGRDSIVGMDMDMSLGGLDSAKESPKGESKEETYTSLIEQYLSIMCNENATFLAERLVAFSKSSHSVYLLALCYYRSGSPRAAQVLLEENLPVESSSTSSSSSSSSSSSNDNNPSASTTPAMQYLLVKCLYDTDQFGPAEEALLEPCRNEYRINNTRTNNETKEKVLTMDEWIITATPCPIPNGAAGLYLLGNICRKSNRKQRAMDYYRMSLQLDPLMWTSYEALCEMGATDDATEIFGVHPAALDGDLTQNASANEKNNKEQDYHGGDPPNNPTDIDPSFSSPAFSLLKTPAVDGSSLEPMELGTPSSGGGTAYLPKTSLFHTGSGGRKAASAKRIPPALFSSSSSLRPPAMTQHQRHPTTASAFFETPNLTPILRNNEKTDVSRVNHHNHASSVSFGVDGGASYASTSNPRVIRRAKHVANRLYYAPSPELSSSIVNTPNHITTRGAPPRSNGAPSSSRFLSGLDDYISSNNTSHLVQNRRLGFAADSPFSVTTTPGPGGVTTRTHTESLSQRQPRALFPPSTKSAAGHDASVLFEPIDEGVHEDTHHNMKTNTTKRPDHTNVHETITRGWNGKDLGGVEEILEMMCVMGVAHQQLCQYRCREALQLFHRLPKEQYHTGWVLHQVGRAHFEMADYQNAKKSLELMQKIEPHRMKGLEILSTALWHLKKDVELSHLAQRAVDFDRMSPESWCVVGNCFSLQKEHDTALTFFRRSIQLDPSFTYPHTLSGHEYVANEDFDKAVACYRDAIRADERHYNAWYGLGAIYYRQEKYDLAEYHFKRALSINNQSSVLHCHLGMAQHANGKAFEALDTLADAFRLDPRNPQARYQRATIYMALDRPHEALAELKKVRDAAPREASVHFAMGRVLKRVGRPEQAMKCFLTALDLDPKENNMIKAAMDKLDEPDVDEEVSAF